MFVQGGSRNGDMKGDDNYIIERYIRCLVFWFKKWIWHKNRHGIILNYILVVFPWCSYCDSSNFLWKTLFIRTSLKGQSICYIWNTTIDDNEKSYEKCIMKQNHKEVVPIWIETANIWKIKGFWLRQQRCDTYSWPFSHFCFWHF